MYPLFRNGEMIVTYCFVGIDPTDKDTLWSHASSAPKSNASIALWICSPWTIVLKELYTKENMTIIRLPRLNHG